ncbi:MAG: HEAT repeat domain-containing protein, partial [Candidatus Aminicenantes bacterium]
MTRSPYKLLDYYRFEDAHLFFGREEETRKMVGEILSSRLLVLFSPSGSGKTSLINAGVRPELEKMGYKTIYTRLEDVPIISVCKAVPESLDLPVCQEKEELYEYLKKAAQAAEKPLVIFLDQFEEFFIVFSDQPKLRQEFVQQVARIKYDDQLPVFLVLSLREDYFANLHEFREDIPSIFQNNANIRLEPFTEKAARRAIEEPLKNKDIEDGQWRFEKKLVDSIIEDLKTKQGIEPIKLQLVCCTLWNQRPGDSKQIPLSTYEASGRADKIFSNFIYERLSKIPFRQHKLMVRIFESLKTPDNTKRYRSFEDLQSQLSIKKTKRLAALLQRLSGFDVLRQEGRKGTHWYEFKHDYVVDEINEWIKERKERINRKRLWYAVLPGIILFISLFTYLFLKYNTFYAGLTNRDYDGQRMEVFISREIDPFGERITTGIFIDDVKQDVHTMNDLISKFKIGFWNKNNWDNLAEKLKVVKRGIFLYKIGKTKVGIKKLTDVWKDESFDVRRLAADSLGSLKKADKNVIDALIQALKDKYPDVRIYAAGLLGSLGKADKNVIDALIQALKDK